MAVSEQGGGTAPGPGYGFDRQRPALRELVGDDPQPESLDPVGTEFQLAAWRALTTIPYGATATYAEQAERLGDRNKARAVGAANARNPLSIVVPCHRVVGADGSLTGFAGGVDTKRRLLDLEAGGR